MLSIVGLDKISLMGWASLETSTTATFVAIMDPGTGISFLFARCRCLYAAAAAAAVIASVAVAALGSMLLISYNLT